MAHLSLWMAARGLSPAELTPAQVERFVEARRSAGYRHLVSGRSLLPNLAGYLERAGATILSKKPKMVYARSSAAGCRLAIRLVSNERRRLLGARSK